MLLFNKTVKNKTNVSESSISANFTQTHKALFALGYSGTRSQISGPDYETAIPGSKI